MKNSSKLFALVIITGILTSSVMNGRLFPFSSIDIPAQAFNFSGKEGGKVEAYSVFQKSFSLKKCYSDIFGNMPLHSEKSLFFYTIIPNLLKDFPALDRIFYSAIFINAP